MYKNYFDMSSSSCLLIQSKEYNSERIWYCNCMKVEISIYILKIKNITFLVVMKGNNIKSYIM